jgi:hypothetical protein
LLAGVSVSWYTWLEQGREQARASVDVLDSVARALRLDAVEREHLLALAGHPHRRAIEPGRDAPPAAVVNLLDALEPAPAYVLGPRWDFLGWNGAFELLFPRVRELSSATRNLVWVVFADPSARALIGSWENEARRVLSQFRAETVPIATDPAVQELVDTLLAVSTEFATWWPRHDVGAFETHRRVFHHPLAGQLEFEQQQLIPAGEPDLRIVVHLPIPGDDSAARLSGTAGLAAE